MTRTYDNYLVTTIKEKQYISTIRDVETTVKPIPDCDIEGAMDPRLYKSQRKISFLMQLLPKNLFKFDYSPKSISRLRSMFNGINSTPITTTKINEYPFTAKAEDGYDIPMIRFQSDAPIKNSPILYYIHGGAFLAGSIDVIREALRTFVEKTNMIAVAIDYRLAPEFPFPIGHKDCYSGFQEVVKQASSWGGNIKSIFVAGDSAGGNLALYCSNRNLEDHKQEVCGQILLYPTVNMAGIKDQYTEFDIEKDIAIYPKQRKTILPAITVFNNLSEGLSQVLQTKELNNIYLSPYSSVSPNLPPTFISVGEHDYLSIESLAYAKKLIDVNVETKVTFYKGMGHAYIDQIGHFPQAEDCIDDISTFVKKHRR